MKSKEELWKEFDPNAPSVHGKIFGLPYDEQHADIVLLPVPWETTVSYRDGTALAPDAILRASSQIDLYSTQIENVWKLGVTMLPNSHDILEQGKILRAHARQHIDLIEQGKSVQDSILLSKINEGCENLNIYVKSLSQRYLREGKLVAVVGGDHSTPLGLIRALSEKYERFGILQLDAHADLRKAYEGFTYSHASIMYNVLKLQAVARLIQVGIRDLCEEEASVIARSMGRVKTFYDRDLSLRLLNGSTWNQLCDEIIKELPPLVYISFDIDGLDPKLCPNTGTPVPGGLQFVQVSYLLHALAKSGRKIIGFDLNEVSPGKEDWDAAVGARILWELCLASGISNGLLRERS